MMDINTRPFDDDARRGDDSVTDAELLLTRLIDHEATTEDRQAFEALAAAEPSLWRQLARRLEDMALLHTAVDDETAGAANAELNELLERRKERAGIEPPTIETGWHSSNSGARWALSSLGWAAAVVFAIFWQINASTTTPTNPNGTNSIISVASAEDAYDEYLEAPFVFSEFKPVLLSTEVLDDGRVIVEFLRRIEEIVIVDSIEALPDSLDQFNLSEFRRSMQSTPNGAEDGIAEDEFQRYLDAPYVIGEYQPTLLDAEEIGDGRYILRFVRRVGEVAMFDSADEVPIDAEGQLNLDPSAFRRSQQNRPMS